MYVTSTTGATPDYTGPGTNALNLSESIAFRDVVNPIADIFIILPPYYYSDTNRDPESKYGAVGFILEWCVQISQRAS